MNKKIIAIDFDGTIVKHNFPFIGDLIPEAKEVINALYNKGHTILIWTVRSITNDAVGKMKKFLDNNGVKYHNINENAEEILNDPAWENFSPKIYADLYIDDRGLGCPVICPTGESYPHVDWVEIECRLREGGIL